MAAPVFTLFVKPYLEGWDNGEEGNTPITAEILNDNYDAFLLALNEWATSIGLLVDGIPTKTSDLNNDSNFVSDASYVHTDNNYTTTEKNKLSGIESNANNYSLPTASASTLGGVKIDGITITIADGVISAVGGGGTDVEGNPSGTPTAVLSSIRIGNDIFSIPGGGGGGSSVSFTQILATGTKIGTITIDGVPTDIYAPTAPTKTSDLNNDSNFISDASYVHTDNNYTTSEKNKLADLNQVEANPSSGTSAGDLTSISVGGTKYNIPSGGGGGTTVIANPSGTATAGNLNKLQVGNDIYSIPSGGSGGGGNKALLWEYSNSYDITLSDDFTNYDFLVFEGNGYSDSDHKSGAIISSEELENIRGISGKTYSFAGASSAFANYNVVSKTSLTLVNDNGSARVLRVWGITANGSGGGTGSGKTLVKKTKTYTGDGQRPLVVTFDEKPLLVYSIYGPGLNETNTVRMYPFVYGETKTSGRYINNDASSGNIGYTIAYSNNDLTMSVTSNPQDAGAGLNNNGSSYTITYLVEENTSGGDYKDFVRTLTAGTTSLTISDIGITSTTTPFIWTSSPVIAPTNMVITSGSITLTFEAQQSNVDVLVRLTKSNAERSYDISLKQFVTGKVFSFMSTQYSTIEEVSNGIKMSGGTTANDWTTNSTVGIDLQQYTIPSGLSKINIHFASIETADYAGICIINSDTLFSGTSPYDDILRASRIYQFEDTTGVDLTDYDIEFNCSSLTGRYLYVMCCDGITPETPEYDNAKNGTFNVIVDGLNFIAGGGE